LKKDIDMMEERDKGKAQRHKGRRWVDERMGERGNSDHQKINEK
jgi:hypothetical protein